MKLAFMLWLISTVGELNTVLGWLTFFSIIITVIGTIVWLMSTEKANDVPDKLAVLFEKWSKRGAIAFLFFVTLDAALPKEKTMYLMAGALAGEAAIEAIGQNKSVQDKLEKVSKIIDHKLTEYLDEEEMGGKNVSDANK